MSISEKKSLERNIFRKLRQESTLSELRNIENNVRKYIDLFLSRNKKIDKIAIYWPLKNEVDIRSLKKNFSLALPRCEEGKKLSFHIWDDKPLTKDLEGIPSPKNSYLLSYEEISLIFVPCLSIDENFIRLGYGGGYFDKLRRDKNWRNIPCIGLLTSRCVSKKPLTRANWDIPLTGYITDKEILL